VRRLVRCWWDAVLRAPIPEADIDCAPARDASDLETTGMSLAGVTASKFVGGRQDLSADGHQGETVPVTDGEVAGRHRLARPPPIADYARSADLLREAKRT